MTRRTFSLIILTWSYFYSVYKINSLLEMFRIYLRLMDINNFWIIWLIFLFLVLEFSRFRMSKNFLSWSLSQKSSKKKGLKKKRVMRLISKRMRISKRVIKLGKTLNLKNFNILKFIFFINNCFFLSQNLNLLHLNQSNFH